MSKTTEQIGTKVAADTLPKGLREHFDKRTKKHISLVQKYCRRLERRVPGLKGLVARGKVHDDSKYNDPELLPYIWLTWRYKCVDDGKECLMPAGMAKKITKATEHHILNNAHHPEYHQKKRTGLINTKDRDATPDKMVDATTMAEMDLAEMVADWCAMAEERGNTARSWAKKTINKRWKFTPSQSAYIYALITSCE